MSCCRTQNRRPAATSVPAYALNSQLRRDPTMTTTIRAAGVAEGQRRWATHIREIRISIADRDCFGLVEQRGLVNVAAGPRQFDFPLAQQKIDAFLAWLEEQERLGTLARVYRPGTRLATAHPWTDYYIDSAYTAGIRRARAKLRRAGVPVPRLEGFNAPVHAEQVGVMYSRAFDELKSVTQFTNQRVRRELAEGLTNGLARGIAEGLDTKTIVRRLAQDVNGVVDKIGRVRTRLIVRTEVARAYHMAHVAEYALGEEELGEPLWYDWVLASNPCPICIDLESGGPYRLEQIRGMIPAHPQCYCDMLPVVERAQARAAKISVARRAELEEQAA